MCGICGAVGFKDASLLERMSSCITNRGPDSVGTYLGDEVMLTNRRLSIIDIEGGDQPIYNEEGDVVVVYNGEIYNFRALRSELESMGHTFTTDTDTEVIVHGYEEWGTDAFERFNGMFAVAIWDSDDERLLLARDRAGIKPLYYADVDEGFVFGSEPKSVLRSGLVEPKVDEDALGYFLQVRYSPSDNSLFEGVHPVLPGTYVEVSEDGFESDSFWSLSDAPDTPPSKPEEAVRETLRDAVERQLVSDVPVGFYLSGGLDTSSVVAMGSEVSDDPIHTFCMGFEDSEWDERPDARAVADHFGTEHHEILIQDDYMQDFPEMIWHADEPKRNLYPYYVAEEMREHVKVALGGLGADELFGGYVYRYNRLGELQDTRRVNALPETAERLYEFQLEEGNLENDDVMEELSCLRHLYDDAELYALLNSRDVLGDTEFFERRLFGEEFNAPRPSDRVRERVDFGDDTDDIREKALRWDFAVKMPDDFLLVEDRMSMAHSLESRVPFLDNGVIDLALSLPLSQKLDTSENRSVGKLVLRRAMKPKLPETVFEKDKQGFTMPTYPFVKDELLSHAKAILNDASVVKEGYVDSGYVDELLGRKPDERLTPHYKKLWKITALEIWYQMYIERGVEEPGEIEDYYT